MLNTLIILGIYILSCGLAWLYIHCLYSKHGRSKDTNPERFDIILVFIPIINLIISIFFIFSFPVKININPNKFFLIKNNNMPAINIKDNIWIEGFDSILGEYNEKLGQYSYYDKDKIVIYYGKTSEIPRILLSDLDINTLDFIDNNKCQCQERVTCYYCTDFLNKSEGERICNQKFCIIYKQKK